jgi:L-iditol 2-dehydrogenase
VRAVRLHGVGDLRIADEPPPDPPAGHSLVRMTAVGLCGSDLHWYGEAGIGDARLDRPLVLGHELAGVTEDGTAVAVDPAIPCETCPFCRGGDRNLCPYVRFAGHGDMDGGLRELIAWPTHLLHPLPPPLTAIDGAMLEPLGVALHAYDLGHVRAGSSVGVVGCGPIGLLLVQLAVAAGCTVVAADLLPHRLAAAERFGARPTGEGLDGYGLDVTFDVSGSVDAVNHAIALARPGARVVLAGIPDDDRTTFVASQARRKGLTIVLVRRMRETYPRAIDLVRRGVVDVAAVVSDRYPLARAGEAFAVAAARTGHKVIVEPAS